VSAPRAADAYAEPYESYRSLYPALREVFGAL